MSTVWLGAKRGAGLVLLFILSTSDLRLGAGLGRAGRGYDTLLHFISLVAPQGGAARCNQLIVMREGAREGGGRISKYISPVD